MANGFYGSLSKLQKINFQFDRVFPNRATMDAEAGAVNSSLVDGDQNPVLIGRYVLVDYNEGDAVDVTLRLGYKQNNTVYAALNTPFDTSLLEENDKIIVLGEFDSDGNYEKYDDEEVWIYKNGNFEQQTEWNTEISNGDHSVYEHNLIVDNTVYSNAGRGWDSTVWQKTYQNGKAKYIMIAELNALSPTLALGIDAPTIVPNNPYFGTDSTLNFYRLHMQPNWGLRVKRATPLTTKRFINGKERSITYSTDLKQYPSDSIGGYATIEGDSDSSPLAIYYNKKGLSKFISASNALDLLEEEEKIAINDNGKAKNFISVTPTGQSGKLYSSSSSSVLDVAPDTYELSIMLPSIGETVSKIWDLVYGENRYYNTDGLRLYYKDADNLTDQTAKAFASKEEKRGFRNIDTYWNSTQGLRSYTKANGQKVLDHDALKTMAGTINSAHDLMGMIIRSYDSLDNVENWDPTKIYLVDGKYYVKSKHYDWKKYDTNALALDDDIYEQIYTLPLDLSEGLDPNKKYLIEEEPDEESGLYTKYFYLGNDENNNRINSYLYRKTSEEYPEILDTEVYDSSYEDIFKTGYSNYIKVKDSSDIIEGATYGFILDAPQWEEGQSQDEKKSGHIYYYYDTSKQYGVNTVCYIKDDDNLSAKKGIYYDLTDYSSHQVDKPFYIPDAYYVKDTQTGLTRLATEATLKAITGSSQWTYSENSRYVFYQKAEPTEGTIGAYVTDSTREEKKRVEVPADRYTYLNGTLTIHKDSNKDFAIDIITNTTYHDQPLIEFSDLQEETPIYYYTSMYLCSDGGYYTLDEININNLTKVDPEVVKPYRYWNPTGGTAEVLAGIESTKFAALQDFSDGEYFYLFEGDSILVLENLQRLKTSQGRERSENLRYYRINDFGSRRKFFFSIGGSYYLTTEGDYKYYPTLHLTDPNEADLTKSNGPLAGETRILSVNFQEIPMEQCRWFKPNVYYRDTSGREKIIHYTDQTTYYERIGNIVGNSEPNWPDGMEWNEDILPPETLVGQRKLTWVPKEIKGLGEDFNTMYGLILKVHQMLLSDDKYNRDSSDIQGIINQSRDILADLKSRGYSYHSVNIVNTDNEEESIEAQGANAAINLRSQTGTVELATLGDDAISLDMAEKYRRWVVPDRAESSSALLFKDEEDNDNSLIIVDDEGNMTIRAQSLTLQDPSGSNTWFEVNGDEIEYGEKPMLVSEGASISFEWDSDSQIFTVYVDGTPTIQIRKQED